MHIKDYRMVARVFERNATHQIAVPKIVYDLAREFEKENPRFDADSFFKASGYPILSVWWKGKVQRPLMFLHRIVIIFLCITSMASCSRHEPAFAGDLSTNFSKSEFVCPCCGQRVIDAELVYRLELLRKELNAPIVITSGFRCQKHNKEVSGVKNSQHLYGKAADIVAKGYTPTQVVEVAKECGFSFIKVYRYHVHVDVR